MSQVRQGQYLLRSCWSAGHPAARPGQSQARKGNYATRVGAEAPAMSGMVSFSIFFTLQ